MLALLELAIQNGAHIIIFPEFIMSEKMKDALRDHLLAMSSSDCNNLLLVLAGTCFHKEGENTFHNILHLFDASGNEIGRCYKFSQFRTDSKAVAEDDASEQVEFFQWFLETADSIWFSDSLQGQDDSLKRKLVLSQVFGEADAAKLLELLQDDSSETLSIKPDVTTIPIPSDAQLSPIDITRCCARYNRSVIGLIDWHSNEGYTTQQYYRTLLDNFDVMLSSCTETEKGICLYTILLDKRTPCQEVPKGLCISGQDYQSAVESIMPSIRKMRYVLALRSTHPSEPASQRLFILQGLKSDEEKAVFLSELMDELQPDGDD